MLFLNFPMFAFDQTNFPLFDDHFRGVHRRRDIRQFTRNLVFRICEFFTLDLDFLSAFCLILFKSDFFSECFFPLDLDFTVFMDFLITTFPWFLSNFFNLLMLRFETLEWLFLDNIDDFLWDIFDDSLDVSLRFEERLINYQF